MDDAAVQYDRADARHPTTFRVDPEALAIAEQLFGPDPDPLPGRWLDNVFLFVDLGDR